jgi:DNA-directed RNA polymerase sigma subunit (sigma70/sigma32)
MLKDGLGDSHQATVQSVAQEFEVESEKIQQITNYFLKQISMHCGLFSCVYSLT